MSFGDMLEFVLIALVAVMLLFWAAVATALYGLAIGVLVLLRMVVGLFDGFR